VPPWSDSTIQGLMRMHEGLPLAVLAGTATHGLLGTAALQPGALLRSLQPPRHA